MTSLLMLLSYHRRLMMISEAPLLYVEGGRVSHSWCMGVVTHGYGVLGGGSDGVGGWYACGTKLVGGVACRERPEHFPSARRCNDDSQSHRHPGAQLWVGSSLNWSVFRGGLNTGRHEKAPVRSTCSRLATLHGASRTLLLLIVINVTLMV